MMSYSIISRLYPDTIVLDYHCPGKYLITSARHWLRRRRITVRRWALHRPAAGGNLRRDGRKSSTMIIVSDCCLHNDYTAGHSSSLILIRLNGRFT